MLLLCLLFATVSTELPRPQRLDPPDRVVYVGETVVLRARGRSGAAQPGVAVDVLLPSGERCELGVADGAGELRYVPEQAGRFEFSAVFANGTQVIAIYHVAIEPKRWLYLVFLMPIGLWLAYRNLRELRARREPPA